MYQFWFEKMQYITTIYTSAPRKDQFTGENSIMKTGDVKTVKNIQWSIHTTCMEKNIGT